MVENLASQSHATEEAETQASGRKRVSSSPPRLPQAQTLSLLSLLSLKVTLFASHALLYLPTTNSMADSQAVCQPSKPGLSAYLSYCSSCRH